MRKKLFVFLLVGFWGCGPGRVAYIDQCSDGNRIIMNGEPLCRTCSSLDCPQGCEVINDMPVCVGNGAFIGTAVEDNLNNGDMYVVSDGLVDIGYKTSTINENVSHDELYSYVASSADTIYHTGHGFNGGVVTRDKVLHVSLLDGIMNTRTIIFSTCDTLMADWAGAIGQTNNLFGYSNLSWDAVDNSQADLYIKFLKSGSSELVSWMLSNLSIGALSDRWVAYARRGGAIVRYDAEAKYVSEHKKYSKRDKITRDKSSRIFLNFQQGFVDDAFQDNLVLDQSLVVKENGKEIGFVNRYIKLRDGVKIKGSFSLHVYDFKTDHTTIVWQDR